MQINIYQVDVFTDKKFGGNPAAVVPYAKHITEDQMQEIANEMGLSETVFVTPIYKDEFNVRYFTPNTEVNLCGHGALGAFYTLALKGYIEPIRDGVKTVFQKTKAGKQGIDIVFKNGEIESLTMEMAKSTDLGIVENLEELLKCFNLDIEQVGLDNEFINPTIISTGIPDIILPIKDKKTLDNLKVDYCRLGEVSKALGVVGVHAFAFKDHKREEVYTRNFAPLVGINEEAATGTANGGLIYFLKKNQLIEGNRLTALQGENLNRPSTIYCYIGEEEGEYKVRIGGKAKIVLEGIMCLQP